MSESFDSYGKLIEGANSLFSLSTLETMDGGGTDYRATKPHSYSRGVAFFILPEAKLKNSSFPCLDWRLRGVVRNYVRWTVATTEIVLDGDVGFSVSPAILASVEEAQSVTFVEGHIEISLANTGTLFLPVAAAFTSTAPA